MAAFATHSELATRLGVELTTDEQSRATMLLGLASDVIRRAARQRIGRETSTIAVSTVGSRVLLPERPAVSIGAVSPDPGGWSLDGDYLTGLPIGGTYSITYDHGYDPVPDTIKAVCLEVVVRVWVNPGNVAQESYGSERVTYGATSGLVLTDEERRAVRDVVRRGSQAIDVR